MDGRRLSGNPIDAPFGKIGFRAQVLRRDKSNDTVELDAPRGKKRRGVWFPRSACVEILERRLPLDDDVRAMYSFSDDHRAMCGGTRDSGVL